MILVTSLTIFFPSRREWEPHIDEADASSNLDKREEDKESVQSNHGDLKVCFRLSVES